MGTSQELRSWGTVKPEFKEGSDKSETARGRRGSGTKSDGDDHRASQRSPRQNVCGISGAAHHVARWVDRFRKLVATSCVQSREECFFCIPENPEQLGF